MTEPIAPTRLEVFQRCPQLWDYEQRWRPRDEEWSPNRSLGIAIAAGLAAHYLAPGLADPYKAGAEEITKRYEADGSPETWTLAGLQTHVDRGIEQGLRLNVVPAGCPVVSVEQTFLACRPDLIHREPQGLVITDWKVSLEVREKYRQSRLNEYEHSWQLLHNAWAARLHFGENVVRAQVGLIILTPKPQGFLVPMPTPPERLEQWHRSANRAWGAAVAGNITMNLGSCTRPWRCPMYEGCHNFYGDESKFPALYMPVGVKIGR